MVGSLHYIWIIAVLKLINVNKRLQCLFFQTGLPHIESGQQALYNPTYIASQLNMEASYLSWEEIGSRVASSSYISSGMSMLSQPGMDLLTSSYASQCQHYYTMENQLFWKSWVKTFNHPSKYQVSYILPFMVLVHLVLSIHISGRTCLKSLQPYNSHFALLDRGFFVPIVKGLVRDFPVDCVLKGLHHCF